MFSATRSWSEWIDRIINNRSTTPGEFVENFDGLRAVAALMVFALHLGTIPHVVLGPAGVFLFFTLSGFLLYSGFIAIQERPDTRTIVAYLTRRMFRVLPLYAVCVVSIALVFSSWTTQFAWDWVKVHLMFVKGDQHLWTMKTEMVFYLYLPLLVLLVHPIRSHRWRFVTLSLAGVAAWYLFEVRQIVQLRGASALFAPFILGMAAVHVRHRITPAVARALVLPSLVAIVLVSSDLDLGRPIREYLGLRSTAQLWGYGYLIYLPCVALVLGVSKQRSLLWGNRFLRLIGVCGFGFYLWHLPIIQVLAWRGVPTPLYEFAAFILTLALSLATYLVVEKPGISLGRTLARWIKKDSRRWYVVRPAWLFLFLVAAFFGYQSLFFPDKSIDISVELWPSQPTVAKVYIDSGAGFSEHSALRKPIREKQWQKLGFNLQDIPIDQLRLDPGETDGEYRIRNISLRFPPDTAWRDLDLEKFQAVAGIRHLHVGEQFLTVVVEPDHEDPILLYSGDVGQPFLHTRNIGILIVIFGTLAFIFASLGLDALMAASRRSSTSATS